MRLVLGATTIMIAAGGCLSFGDLSGGGAADAGGDTIGDASGNDGSLLSNDGSVGDGSTTTDGGPLGPCPGTGGPPGVRVQNGPSNYCVDATEVSQRQYKQFLAALDAGTSALQPSYCAFNASYGMTTVRADDDFPATGVDWCDAYAFCAWAGKRLCGNVAGGPISVNDFGTPSKSQWLGACTTLPDGGVEPFPYGDTFEPKSCNGVEYNDGGSLVEVGSLATCEGSVPGVFDMIGNVDEWTDDCDGTTGSNDCCEAAGGGYHDNDNGCGIGALPPTTCTGRTRNQTHSDVGFRCCSK
jgi:formylglycine-generating enzyme required for sulfatase activity